LGWNKFVMNATLFFVVAAGGAFGTILRYATLLFVTKYSDIPSYFATLFVNITVSFVAVCIVALVSSTMFFLEPVRVFIMVGLLGSLTSFSTFSLDSNTIFQREDYAILAIFIDFSYYFDMFFRAWFLGIKD
jgi:CrcB protein